MKSSFIIATIIASAACSSVKLPPAKALSNGYYFLPGCGLYDDTRNRNWIIFETAQEAELSGYRPSGTCRAVAAARVQQEIELYGRMSPTAETESRKAATIQAREMDRKIQELERKQDELQDEQEKLEDKKVDKELGY